MLFPSIKSPLPLRSLVSLVAVAACLALSPVVHAQSLTGNDLDDPTLDAQDGKSGPPVANPDSKPRDDKSQYNLFNPTPDDLLRGFRSARPDQTTGAHSVDAGHFYLETGVAYSLGLGATRTDTWNYFQSSHVRIGLTNYNELELIYSGIDETRTQTLQPGGRHSDTDIVGSNSLTARLRIVVLGADKGPIAFAIDPEINLPTVSHHISTEFVTGDVLFCLSAKLPAGFSVTINADPGLTRNGSDTGNVFGITTGITLYHNIFRKQDHVEPYLEYYDTLATGPGSTDQRQVDVGVRWEFIKNVQLDFGCNFGVSADAPDYQPFLGLSTRF